MNKPREVWDSMHYSAVRDSKIRMNEFDDSYGSIIFKCAAAMGFILTVVVVIFALMVM